MPPSAARTIRLDGWRLFLVLTLIAAAFLTPGIARLPAIDRDEARFMQATKQMVESGDYGYIRFQTEPRDKKPPGAYWLQAASVRWLAGGPTTERWPYRLPSILGVIIAVLATAVATRNISDSRSAFVAGAIIASAPIVVVEGHLAKADAPLLGLSAICFAVLCLSYCRRAVTSIGLIAFWLSLGAGIVIKGPVLIGLCVVAVTSLSIADRSAAWLWRLRPLIGLPLAASAMLAWIQVSGWSEVARFSQSAALQDLLPKLAGGIESHGAPPGSHLIAALATLWPWSALLPIGAIAAWQQRQRPEVRFCLAWILPVWLAFELIPTKLPHYILPLVPAIALLMAVAWSRERAAYGPTSSLITWTGRLILLAFPIVVGFLIVSGVIAGLLPMSAPLVAAVILPWVIVVTIWRHHQSLSQVPAALVIAALFDVCLFQWVLPQAPSLNVAGALAARVDKESPLALAGFHEPSAVFALGTKTTLTDSAGAADFLLARPGAVAVVAADEVDAVERRLTDAGRSLFRIDRISGYNYGRGASVDLVIVKVAP